MLSKVVDLSVRGRFTLPTDAEVRGHSTHSTLFPSGLFSTFIVSLDECIVSGPRLSVLLLSRVEDVFGMNGYLIG